MKAPVRHLLALAVAALAPLAHADFYLIVQAANPQPALTQREAVGMFMGRNRAFHSGEVAQVYDLPRDSTQRAEFYQRLTGMGPAQINSYWARLMFSGQTMPPYAVQDEAAMVAVEFLALGQQLQPHRGRGQRQAEADHQRRRP